jgi:rare lipoprotein A
MTLQDGLRPALLSTALLAPALWAMPLGAHHQDDGDDFGGRALGTGMASYYAQSFAGQRTASGEPYRPGALTAAHRSAPFGSRIAVRNLGNGRAVTVRVNDRGPHMPGRIIDLSYAAAQAIGVTRSGTARVSLTLLED